MGSKASKEEYSHKEPFTKNSKCKWCDKVISENAIKLGSGSVFYVKTIRGNDIYCGYECHRFDTEEYQYISEENAYGFVAPECDMVFVYI